MNNAHSPVILFNNCGGYDHAAEYGRGAFFDLNTYGVQAKQANDLERGDVCVVAIGLDDCRVEFGWFAFQRETIDPQSGSRVFFGKHMKSESLTKAKALHHRVYSDFFNINGHFKRQSSIRP